MGAVCALLAVWLGLLTGQAPPADVAARLRVGDLVAVRVVGVDGYDGEYRVLTDGHVIGLGFGRLRAEGRTVAEVRTDVAARLRSILRDPVVEVTLKEQRVSLVYVAGLSGAGNGPVVWTPGLDLRSLVTTAASSMPADEHEVVLFRAGRPVVRVDLYALLSRDDPAGATPLQPDDVATVVQSERIRVWVLGAARTPGVQLARPDTDLYQAVAKAGGIALEGTVGARDVKLRLRRGPDVTEFPALPEADGPRPILAAGDVIEVVPPTPARVMVGGEVARPGEVQVRAGGTVEDAIQLAGGAEPTASLTDVLVIRDGEMMRVDVLGSVRNNRPMARMPVEDGDAIVVRRNERFVTVLGKVNRQGEFRMEETREYRLATVVALAGGPMNEGSLTRVFHARKGDDGRVVVTEYRLDRYIKDGDLTQNPVVEPGDAVFVGPTRGLTLSAVTQLLSGAILLNTLLR